MQLIVAIYPEAKAVYKERSPINHVDKLNVPIVLFQGDEVCTVLRWKSYDKLQDKVVPPDQARKMYEAVKQKGLPVSLNVFEGEQHGFVKAKNIKATLVCLQATHIHNM
jgi:dipeptidyl aminopeptidase/acylaminoacyl peptidase